MYQGDADKILGLVIIIHPDRLAELISCNAVIIKIFSNIIHSVLTDIDLIMTCVVIVGKIEIGLIVCERLILLGEDKI